MANFGGVPHRLEVVRALDGVTYVNDSASTAPVAGVAALRSFSEPVVLIAGGNSKNLDASEYAGEAARRAKRVILLDGNASDEFAAAATRGGAEQGRADAETFIAGPYDDLAAALETRARPPRRATSCCSRPASPASACSSTSSTAATSSAPSSTLFRASG